MNYEAIDEMLFRLRSIDRDIALLRDIQILYPNYWNWMIRINELLARLIAERDDINFMLEDEYLQMDIDKILYRLSA